MIEYAMTQTQDGERVPRPDAEKSLEKFRRAVAERGGSMPAGIRWSETRGFHTPGAESRTALRSSLTEAAARQRAVAREIRHEAVTRELDATRALVRGASPLAWQWARLFRAGRLLEWGASPDERTGWRLAQLGYYARPLWLLREQLGQAGGLTGAIDRQIRVTRELHQEVLRLSLSPGLAALAAKLDRTMR